MVNDNPVVTDAIPTLYQCRRFVSTTVQCHSLRSDALHNQPAASRPPDLDRLRADCFVVAPSLDADPVLAFDEEKSPLAITVMLP